MLTREENILRGNNAIIRMLTLGWTTPLSIQEKWRAVRYHLF
jgi:hypothetical protein